MNKLFEKVESLRDYVLELQKNMTSRPAITPDVGGHGEYDKAQYLEGELKKLKFNEIFRVDAPDARAKGGIRPNIIAKYYGKDTSRTLWLLAHTDVVPEGDRALWNTDPFELSLQADGDTIIGRGVEDNQQAVATAVAVAKAVIESGTVPPVNLGLMLLADEEFGNKFGIEYVLKQRPDLFGKNDSFIVQDSGDPEGKEVEIAEKNVAWFKFTVHGKQSHASTPNMGNNAFYAGSLLAVRLADGLRAKFNKVDTLFDPSISTYEPTKKEANIPNINTIPATDIFYLDSRTLPSYTPQEVRAEVDRIVKTVEDELKVKVNIDIINSASSVATSPDDKLVQLYVKAVREVNKVEPKVLGIGGGTFAAEVRNLGLPVVVGSKIYGEPHSPNERASLNFTIDDAKVVSYVLMNM